jgi:hypothetical protein
MLLPKLLPPDAATAPLRRLRPTATQLADFKGHLAEMLRHLDPAKIERHGETHILDFLRLVTRPAEGGGRYGNVNGKRDLVLHLGDTAASPVAVVLEVKGPRNPKEMLAPDDLNRKALHQLLLYYLEDRTDDKADDFRRLIITTGYEWYVFDALDFNRLFWQDKAFVKAFRDWKAGAKAAEGTDFFYKSIAGKQLAALTGELPVAYVDLRAGLPAAPAALLSSGLNLSKAPERHTTLGAPLRFQLVDGPQPGTLCAKAKRPPHAVALKYLYTLDASEPDIEWYTVVVHDGDALLTQCKSADRVYCKVAAVGGDTDQQPYTDVLSRLVQ